MSNIDKQMKLANEAVELIKEFRETAAVIGENFLKGICIKDDGAFIEIDDEYEGVKEYALTHISSVFTLEMRGWGPCNASFYEGIGLAEAELEYDYKEYSKEEFKEYVGNLKYAEYRCEEIYLRLEEIENEALAIEE